MTEGVSEVCSTRREKNTSKVILSMAYATVAAEAARGEEIASSTRAQKE